mmetsp:Transcript_37018/g.56764  ORF Transcript_37018/g.56764 Transcript_37018/m.56764 type:complete len:169 (+) Transcript_37018:401-907(+)
MPWENDIELRFENLDISLETALYAKDGMILPNLNFIHIDFGQSFFYHRSWLVRTMMHQLLSYSIKVIENAAALYGPALFNEVLGPMLNHMTHEYTYPFRYTNLLAGSSSDIFDLDLRPTADPQVTKAHFDYRAVGAFTHDGMSCSDFSPEHMNFRGELSQIVISQATA